MDATWRLRFEDLIHEANGQEIPSIVRARELEKVVVAHLADFWEDSAVDSSINLDFEITKKIMAGVFFEDK